MVAQRYQTAEKAEFEIYGKGKVYYATLKNLSKTGAFLEIRNDGRLPTNGTLLHIRVRLDQVHRVHNLDAEVKWQSETGMGIQFVKKTDVMERMFRRINF